MTHKTTETLKGVLHFFTETGTEGGYWAFQDEKFIAKNVGKGVCKKCGYAIREQSGAVKLVRISPLNEQNDKPKCPSGTCEERFGEEWSYSGLHILKNGDKLTIFSPEDPTEIVWSGVISLKKYPLFTEDAFGFWIHADQKI